jgi:hypothetical protein
MVHCLATPNPLHYWLHRKVLDIWQQARNSHHLPSDRSYPVLIIDEVRRRVGRPATCCVGCVPGYGHVGCGMGAYRLGYHGRQ